MGNGNSCLHREKEHFIWTKTFLEFRYEFRLMFSASTSSASTDGLLILSQTQNSPYKFLEYKFCSNVVLFKNGPTPASFSFI